MRVLPCGDRALIAEFDTLEHALGAHTAWSAAAPEGIIELVPGARTMLVRIDPSVIGLGHAEHWLREHPPAPFAHEGGRTVTLPVVYDGDDLDAVAAAWGCSRDAVAHQHAAHEWVCGFLGFAPGFAYLVAAPGQTPLPVVPRRATSRPRAPAGSVALAAEYSAVYPRESPGGWQLIGRTDEELWNAARDDPALITPGTLVRFEAVRA